MLTVALPSEAVPLERVTSLVPAATMVAFSADDASLKVRLPSPVSSKRAFPAFALSVKETEVPVWDILKVWTFVELFVMPAPSMKRLPDDPTSVKV